MDTANNKDWDLVGTCSIQLIISLMSLHQTCFTGETLVATEDGQKRIDEIEVGDKVLVYDIYTGETELKEVLTVFIHDQTEILHLHTTVGDIDTTTNHPFSVIGKCWVVAGDLSVGDEVYLLNCSSVFITGSDFEELDKIIQVYNLEFADYNTYFVGDVPVLVHNYKNKTTKGFWKDYDKLSPENQRAVDEVFAMFKQNPNHPGLNFEDMTQGKLSLSNPRTFLARTTKSLCAYAHLIGDVLEWFEINTHDYKSIRRK